MATNCRSEMYGSSATPQCSACNKPNDGAEELIGQISA
eukprot:CAMPEP_0115167222 /NCGR_PEP_ID=MMETSP0270-20121206/101_1 /TAXON_ID=71861 /ORGANISM="Scrippsiella trochoidea, Strain CCMP3099" /LENGTH=37 /DNA_ID= /DNA_START= /DNA_END= /DNA_ORIENTATION=